MENRCEWRFCAAPGAKTECGQRKNETMNPDEERKAAATMTACAADQAAGAAADEVLRGLDTELDERVQALRESERLSEADYAIRINVWD